jgi:hypothetical protein
VGPLTIRPASLATVIALSYPDAKIATANGASRRSAPAINPDESSELGARLSTARGNQAASH